VLLCFHSSTLVESVVAVCVETLRQLISKALTMASGDGLTSIAFPAVGTGHLQFPSDLVGRAMFEEVKSFSGSSPQTSVSSILFVVYDADTETLSVSRAVVFLLEDAFILHVC